MVLRLPDRAVELRGGRHGVGKIQSAGGWRMGGNRDPIRQGQIGGHLNHVRHAGLALQLEDERAGRRLRRRQCGQRRRHRRELKHRRRIRRERGREIGAGDRKIVGGNVQRGGGTVEERGLILRDAIRVSDRIGGWHITGEVDGGIEVGVTTLVNHEQCQTTVGPPRGVGGEQFVITGGGDDCVAPAGEVFHQLAAVVCRVAVDGRVAQSRHDAEIPIKIPGVGIGAPAVERIVGIGDVGLPVTQVPPQPRVELGLENLANAVSPEQAAHQAHQLTVIAAAAIFSDIQFHIGADLPIFTRMVVDMSKTLKQVWWLILGIIIAVTYIFIYFKQRSKTFNRYLDRTLLKIPVIGTILNKSAIARFSRTLSTLSAAGVPLVNALNSVSGACGNIMYCEAVLKMREEVATGQRLQFAMLQTMLFPHMVQQMIAIGEESGSMDAMLAKVADFYEEEVDNLVDNLSSLMEPMIMVVLGVLIGGLVVAMYLPIFKMGAAIS